VGMDERDPSCPEADALVFHRTARAVPRVAEDVPAAVGELHPDLMVPTGMESHLQDGVMGGAADGGIGELRDTARPRSGGISVTAGNDTTPVSRRILLYPVFQDPLSWFRRSGDDRNVVPLHRSQGELLVQRRDRLFRSAEDDDPPDRLVDPVNRLNPSITKGVPPPLHNGCRSLPGALDGVSGVLCNHQQVPVEVEQVLHGVWIHIFARSCHTLLVRILQFSGSDEDTLGRVEGVIQKRTPDLVVCTGPDAMPPAAETYRGLASRFARWETDYLVLPGPTDDASLFFGAFGRRYRIDPGYPHLDRFVRAGGATLLLVDTRDGCLGEHQQRWLESVLSDVATAVHRGDRGGPVILCTPTVGSADDVRSVRSVLKSLTAPGIVVYETGHGDVRTIHIDERGLVSTTVHGSDDRQG